MNASKFFVSTAAAITVVGAIGIAYAQTTPAPGATGAITAPEATTQTQPQPTAPSTSTTQVPQSGTADGAAASNDRTPGAAGTDASGLASERAAQTDRN